jgi:glycosyltransferase involved in cell wall biosynthesis
VRDQLPPFEFRVLGPGAARPWQREAARRGLDDRVRFCGILPSGPPVLAWLDEIDLYLQPSFQEGLPRALIEAMSRGCPALGSTAGGIPELLQASCLHHPGTAAELGRLILRAASAPDWQAVQAERNFTVAKRYTSDTLGPRRLAFWRGFADYAGRQGGLSCAAPSR